MFPCECANQSQLVPHGQGISAVTVHGISATAMFLLLVYFCYSFYQIARGKARTKAHKRAKRRACVYVGCRILIVLSILTLAFDHFSKGILSSHIPRLTFWGNRPVWWRLDSPGSPQVESSLCLQGKRSASTRLVIDLQTNHSFWPTY